MAWTVKFCRNFRRVWESNDTNMNFQYMHPYWQLGVLHTYICLNIFDHICWHFYDTSMWKGVSHCEWQIFYMFIYGLLSWSESHNLYSYFLFFMDRGIYCITSMKCYFFNKFCTKLGSIVIVWDRWFRNEWGFSYNQIKNNVHVFTYDPTTSVYELCRYLQFAAIKYLVCKNWSCENSWIYFQRSIYWKF